MRIGLVGSHGVGKTTLVEMLLKILPAYKTLEEHSHKVLNKGKGLNFKTTNETQLEFYKSYLEMFEKVENENLITPRTVVDLLAYSRYFHKHDYGIDLVLIKRMEQLIKVKSTWIDLYIYIPIEFKQKEVNAYREGQKEHPEYQKEIDDNVKTILKEFDIPYMTVTGSVLKRAALIRIKVREYED